MKRRVVLLDRDGTIIFEKGHLSSPEQVELLPGAALGLREMQRMGFRLVVVTNQSAIGRGYFDRARLDEIHGRLKTLLATNGVALDGMYACPHAPDAGCACRKPRPGLVHQAASEMGFDPRQAIMIGDKPCDVDLGRAVGATTLLVRTGYGADHERQGTVQPDGVVDDLRAAATWLSERASLEGGSFLTQRTRFVSEVPKGTQVRVGVGVLVLDDRNRVLLERRSDCGLWGLLGGQVEAGESVLAATIREVKEESGLDVRILGLLGVYSEPSEGRVAIYPDNTVQLVDIVFTAAITAGQLSISAESDELRFFDGDQLPANLVPPARQPLMDFVGGRSGVVR